MMVTYANMEVVLGVGFGVGPVILDANGKMFTK